MIKKYLQKGIVFWSEWTANWFFSFLSFFSMFSADSSFIDTPPNYFKIASICKHANFKLSITYETEICRSVFLDKYNLLIFETNVHIKTILFV